MCAKRFAPVGCGASRIDLAVLDPWLSLAALALTLVGKPVLPDLDPGPSPYCPKDMK